MIACFSFCDKDASAALDLARYVDTLRGVERHRCVVSHPMNVDASELIRILESVFGRVTDDPYGETVKGWPDGPNAAFQHAAETISTMPDGQPWLWLEMDCVPTRSKWLDDLEAEYRAARKPILGVTVNTFDPNGKPIGRHVAGVAVYPADLFRKSPEVRSVMNMTHSSRYDRRRKPQGETPAAFDCYIAGWTLKNMAESRQIADYWRSCDYREITPYGRVETKYQCPYGKSPVVNMDAALIHGCKDQSLLDIVQRRLTGDPWEPPVNLLECW